MTPKGRAQDTEVIEDAPALPQTPGTGDTADAATIQVTGDTETAAARGSALGRETGVEGDAGTGQGLALAHARGLVPGEARRGLSHPSIRSFNGLRQCPRIRATLKGKYLKPWFSPF